MTSYAVTARIDAVSPHLRDRAWSIVTMPSAEVDQPAVIVETADQVGRALPGWDDLARVVIETMFYMLDPEGWR